MRLTSATEHLIAKSRNNHITKRKIALFLAMTKKVKDTLYATSKLI